jgi:hypothetical protein
VDDQRALTAMADTPPKATPAPKGLLDRLKGLLPGGEEAAPDPRWPHRRRGWLDPNVPLHGWRNRIDVADAPEALGAIADRSDGRIDAAGVAEVLDVLRELKEPTAFRFGAPDAYRQVWLGLAPDEVGGVRLFLLSDLLHTERVEAALSVAGFQHPAKKAEYDRLRRFLVGIWEWRATPGSGAAHVEGHDAAIIAARLDRTVNDPQSPALEVLRGLRTRTRQMVAELAPLDAAGVKAADAWLAARGAPTLTELRGTFGAAG